MAGLGTPELLIVLFVYIADVRVLAAMQDRFDSRFRTT